MPQSITAMIDHRVLQWARKSAGVTVEEAARRAAVAVERYEEWEHGDDTHPTMAKLRMLADMFKRPLAIMFLPEPPAEREPMTDYRRPSGGVPAPLSRQLRLQVRRAFERREYALSMTRESDEPPPEIRLAATLDDDPDEVAGRIRVALGVDLNTQCRWPTRRDALHAWRDAIERLGVLVFQISRVESDEARGFSIAGQPLPVIAVNRKEWESGRIFTLFHELTHVLLHAESLCELSEDASLPPQRRQVEIFCNRVAGAALVPEPALLASEVVAHHDATPVWDDNALGALARQFNVGREVILRRLLIIGRTTDDFYRRWRRAHPPAAAAKGGTGGPSPAVDTLSTLGPTYTRLVLRNFYQERITVSDLSNQLRINLKHLPELEERAFRR